VCSLCELAKTLSLTKGADVAVIVIIWHAKKRSMLTKLVGAALIFLTLVSTAVVVAKSCHDEPTVVAAVTTVAHTSHGDHVHTPPANSALIQALHKGTQ
jgi:hypothetical protein